MKKKARISVNYVFAANSNVPEIDLKAVSWGATDSVDEDYNEEEKLKFPDSVKHLVESLCLEGRSESL